MTKLSAREKVGFPIDQSGNEAITQDLVINQPGKKVALLLSYTAPIIWNIQWTRGTEIVAVWASSDVRNAVAGLPRSVPVFETIESEKSPCGSFKFYVRQFAQAAEMSHRAFARPVREAISVDIPKGWVGEKTPATVPLEFSNDVTIRSLESKSGWNYGDVAMRRLEQEGYVRKAYRKEIWEWLDAWTKQQDIPPVDNPQRTGQANDRIDTLVILKPFQMPPNARAYFLVPNGMSRPTGDLSRAGFIDWNTMTCCGVSYGCPVFKPCASTR